MAFVARSFSRAVMASSHNSSAMSPVHSLWAPHLPDHCDPTSPFLFHLSSYSHTCIPTPLAFISTLLGTLSIISWLFAQLPQIVKNFRLRSTSGLSIFFLVEWCLGDISNLVGAVLTHQATWQVIIASYYCFVDLALVAQWLWYEKLKHGRHLRKIWLTKYRGQFDHDEHSSSMQQVVGGDNIDGTDHHPTDNAKRPNTSAGPRPIYAFHTPEYNNAPAATGLSPNHALSASQQARSQTRNIRRAQAGCSPLPSPSPRTLLFLSVVICLCSTTLASPVSPGFRPAVVDGPISTPAEMAGTCISWLSTVLYLGSRLPQLIKNARLRSTAGLSPLLFLAAFMGNLFYSSSMLCNPLVWRAHVPPYGEHGWAPADGSNNGEWIANALPFFLGAAGVLIMDASIGVQFWLYSSKRDDEVVIVVDEDEGAAERPAKAHWRRVSGWMRGWSPGFGSFVGGTPTHSVDGGSVRSGIEGERQALLDGRGETYGAA